MLMSDTRKRQRLWCHSHKSGIPEWLKGSNGDGRQEEKSNASLRYPRACPEVLRQPDDAMRHQKDLNGCLTM